MPEVETPHSEVSFYYVFFHFSLLTFSYSLERGWEHTASNRQGSWRSPRSSTGTSQPRISKIWVRSAEGLTALSVRWCTSQVTRSWRSRWLFTFIYRCRLKISVHQGVVQFWQRYMWCVLSCRHLCVFVCFYHREFGQQLMKRNKSSCWWTWMWSWEVVIVLTSCSFMVLCSERWKFKFQVVRLLLLLLCLCI